MKKLSIQLLMLSWAFPIFSFVHLPYQEMSYGTLDFKVDTFKESSEAGFSSDKNEFIKKTYGSFGADFSFRRMSYGITGIKITTPIELFTYMGHNFVWTPLDYKLPILKTKHTLQLGALHVGIPKILAEISMFNISNKRKLKRYFISQRSQLLKEQPYFGYLSLSNSVFEPDRYKPYAAIAYESKGNSLYLETDSYSLFLGTQIALQSYGRVGTYIGYNIRGDVNRSWTLGFVLNVSENIVPDPNKKIELEKKPLNMGHLIPSQLLPDIENGLAAFQDAEFEKALAYYKNVLEEAPYLIIANIRIGSIYYQLKNYPKAREHWKKALEEDPDNTEIGNLLKQLD